MKRKLGKNTVDKYKRIIDEWFINGFDGINAYKKYFPLVKKDTTATVNFSKIKALDEVQEYIDQKHEEAAKVVEATHEGLLQELKNWVESDITETIALTPEQIKLLPIKLRRLITKFKHTTKDFYNTEGSVVSTVETIELHFVSKERAMDMISRHCGFYEADNLQKASLIDYNALSPDTLIDLWNARKKD